MQLNRLGIRRGGRLLFEEATLTIHQGQRAGIVGANGCGKSSLFQLVLGEIEADSGACNVVGDPVIAHVAQHVECDARNSIEQVLDGDVELRQLQHELTVCHDGVLHARLQLRFEEIDGYGAAARAAKLLSGLGFDDKTMGVPANSLSGGWRMRISLARALMCRSDLLLLDEPTNHLDLDAVIWLEQWLLRYRGTLLLISHDREFLDRIVNQVVAIEQLQVVSYSGNYSDFESTRSARLGQQNAAYQKQQREIKHMRAFVDRFRVQATKARQAQSRLKALERMEKIAPAHVDSQFHFAFKQPKHLPNPILRLEEISAGYNQQPVLSGINLSLAPGDRIGLLGLNGAGKSTLSRLLALRLSPLTGLITPANAFTCGYFAQEQLELLNPAQTPAEHYGRAFGLHDQQILRNHLGGFGFSGDRVFETVAPFSGGEKARLVLSMVVYQRPNLLILDEPTNHLDLEMRHALTVALQSYEGAVVLVSHDRYLLRATADKLLLVDSGTVQAFDGDLDDYPRWLTNRRRNPKDATPKAAETNSNRRDIRRQKAELRQQLKPLYDQVRKLERQLDKLHRTKDEIDHQLGDSALYQGENHRLKTLLKEQATAREALEFGELELMNAMETLEHAELEVASV